MFICGSPHLGALCMFALVTGLCVLSFSQWFVCLSLSFLIPYFACFLVYRRPTPQHYSNEVTRLVLSQYHLLVRIFLV